MKPSFWTVLLDNLEHEVIEHAGDHSFSGKKLDNSDPEDDERGADMRDRRP